MKYLRKFENNAAYESATLDLPNVAYCEEENEVHYTPLLIIDGHEYVEIAGVKWATINVGASNITDTGLYFQWGDTQGYTVAQVEAGEKDFDWTDCKYTNDGGFTFTKYNSIDRLVTLESSDDAVQAAWGSKWRMPTTEEFIALSDAVTTQWVTDYQGSGVNGRLMTGKSGTVDEGKTLFFPACGYCDSSSVSRVGSEGSYWSSSLYSRDVQYANYLYFDSGLVGWQYN